MVRKINYGKILLVIFLTVLIWVSADLAKTEKLPVSGGKITVGNSTEGPLWISFGKEYEGSVAIDSMVLKGSTSTIDKVKRKLRDGSLSLEFSYWPQVEDVNEPEYLLDVFDFLRRNDQIRRWGLTVESCKPDKLSVNVVKLAKKSLTVKCFDEDGNPLKAESKPSEVNMFVPEHWEGEALTAKVRLTRGEIEQARMEAVPKKPYVKVAPGQIREAAGTVEITAPPEEERLSDYTITAATLAIALSPNLQGKYKVVVSNLDAVMESIAIRATLDAQRAYKLQPYPLMTLYIFDDDAQKGTEEQRREVVYNFPPEFVRKGEIELKNPDQPAEAKFKLIPLASGGSASDE